ncbi:MAG: 50S ribosomal protein L15 [Eubacteriaceae bacterium]|nr:50S ribosomal protein L15 [Eubacteriaceae bacterium]
MALKLNELKPAPGSRKKPTRKGRGIGSGKGKTAGRGQDGQNSRSGGGVRPGFEGGQMPLTRRVPKRGFSNARFKKVYAVVNLEKLAGFESGEDVNLETLKGRGIVKNKYKLLKILGNGELDRALNVTAHKISAGAAEKIIAAGGKAEALQ